MPDVRIRAYWPSTALVFVDDVRVRIHATPSRVRWRCDADGEGGPEHCTHTLAAATALANTTPRRRRQP